MKLLIRLVSIDYKGTVGRDWSFTISFGAEFEFPFNAQVVSGVPRIFNKPVYFDTIRYKKRQSITVGVKATERDKAFPESGMSSKIFNIDLTSSQPQNFGIGVDVKEDRGPKVKTNATGHLDFKFVATIAEDEEACMGIGEIEFDVTDKENLKTKDFTYVEMELGIPVNGATILKGGAELNACVYRKDGNWRMSVVTAGKEIVWGYNQKRFRDIVFPGGGRKSTVNCNTVDEMLRHVDIYIRKESVPTQKVNGNVIGSLAAEPPAKGNKPLWYVREIIEAHERVHVKTYGDILRSSWPDFQKRINESVIGSEESMTAAEAWKAGSAILEKIGDELTDCVSGLAGEDEARRIDVDALKEVRRKLIAFKDVECGPIFNSKTTRRKTPAKKRTVVKKKTKTKKRK